MADVKLSDLNNSRMENKYQHFAKQHITFKSTGAGLGYIWVRILPWGWRLVTPGLQYEKYQRTSMRFFNKKTIVF